MKLHETSIKKKVISASIDLNLKELEGFLARLRMNESHHEKSKL